MNRRTSLAGIALLLAPLSLVAQSGGPAVGELAPDFTLPIATREGVAEAPLTLSSLRGGPVVLAFFPRARTGGCTVQMRAYRDRFDELFGDDVTLIAISNDPAAVLASWAAEEDFPFRFASDSAGAAGLAYGAFREDRGYESRFLYVIGADGRVHAMMKPFAELDPTSYETLGATLDGLR